MQLWSIIVPRFDNKGQSYEHALVEFEHDLLECWEGFTSQDCEGTWYDVANRHVYHDQNREYRILCDSEPALVSLAADRFPDQLAFAIFKLGEGDIWNRPVPCSRD